MTFIGIAPFSTKLPFSAIPNTDGRSDYWWLVSLLATSCNGSYDIGDSREAARGKRGDLISLPSTCVTCRGDGLGSYLFSAEGHAL
jgi:hypothetical protein